MSSLDRYKKSLLVIWLFVFLIATKVYSQTNLPPTNIDLLVQPSPTVSQLLKFTEAPVGYYTGTPEINIPISQIKGKSLTIPISISYHASGIKVSDIAGSTGLGWALSSGGAIGRIKRGRCDEIQDYGFMDFSVNELKPFLFDLSAWLPNYTNDKDLKRDILQGSVFDFEPDVFTFNFNGYSGKLVFNPKKESFSIVPLKSFKVAYEKSLANTVIQKWIITDNYGIIYFFESQEYTDPTSSSGRTVGDENGYVSSWLLTKVVDPIHNDSILLEYTPVTENYTTGLSESRFYPISLSGADLGPCQMENLTYSTCTNIINSGKIARIVSNLMTADFYYQLGRLDYYNNSGCLLDSIVII